MTINKELSEDEQDNKTQYEYFGFQKKRRELEGGLYLVSTPIGNLEDITLRALRVLQEVDFIAAEDTRTARKLLHAYELSNQIISFYRDNEAKKIPQIIESLKAGKRIALISEAGTPAISDPGFRLIREARKEELNIIPIPGASAAIPALISSGIPCDHFLFLGFLPTRKGKRQQTLSPYIDLPITLIFYMSPHNAIGLLRDLQEFLGDRQAFIARELTKKYEQFIR
jgi:16S rRNA (cytidine1402-2'-O)-methyltransferase